MEQYVPLQHEEGPAHKRRKRSGENDTETHRDTGLRVAGASVSPSTKTLGLGRPSDSRIVAQRGRQRARPPSSLDGDASCDDDDDGIRTAAAAKRIRRFPDEKNEGAAGDGSRASFPVTVQHTAAASAASAAGTRAATVDGTETEEPPAWALYQRDFDTTFDVVDLGGVRHTNHRWSNETIGGFRKRWTPVLEREYEMAMPASAGGFYMWAYHWCETIELRRERMRQDAQRMREAQRRREEEAEEARLLAETEAAFAAHQGLPSLFV